MDSLNTLKAELIETGFSPRGAEIHADALVIHACMCRTRADTPTPGGFRELVAYTCDLTRKDGCVDQLRDDIAPSVRTIACEALFDLIMEGVP